MNLPIKIYLNDTKDIKSGEKTAYIHKAFLIDWAKKQVVYAKNNNLAYTPYENLIDTLNSI